MVCAIVLVFFLQLGCGKSSHLDTEWLKLLPEQLKPNGKLVRQLERVRRDFDMPHEEFAFRVGNSPIVFRKVIESTVEQLREDDPTASQRDLLITGLILFLTDESGKLPPLEVAGRAMQNIFSVDDLCNYTISVTYQLGGFRRNSEIESRIDEILAQQRNYAQDFAYGQGDDAL